LQNDIPVCVKTDVLQKAKDRNWRYKERILEMRSNKKLKNFCYKIGRIRSSMTEKGFAGYCGTHYEACQNNKGHSMQRSLTECFMCPLGAKVATGKKVNPSNVRFIKL